MKTFLKSKKGIQGFILLSDVRNYSSAVRFYKHGCLRTLLTTYFKKNQKHIYSWYTGLQLCSPSRYSRAVVTLKYNLLHPTGCTSYTGL